MNVLQEMQLQIIRQVTTLLQTATIPHWLFGGWAIDFQLNEIARLHDDVEFLVWQIDAPRIASILAQYRYKQYT